jgi:choline dehydrogenase-like flavoprotein
MSGAIRSTTELTADHEVSCDVCIVGSGAGGAVLAAGLCAAGLDVVMLEAGSHRTSADFRALQEGINTPMLYQDRGARATADLAITVLQGRTVGGSTTVNWTTCFRTPERILEHWATEHGLEALHPQALAPHFEAVEERLNIHPWDEALANPNNHALLAGCRALGWQVEALRRNVKGCANSGYCGFGCPFDAKQAMHLTYLPDAVADGLTLWADAHVERIELRDDRAVAVHVVGMQRDRDHPNGRRMVVRPKVVAVSGGAINSPALLLRSGLTDGPVGRRTFLHPVIAVPGEYEQRVSPWYGAPQSVSSHQFVDRGPQRMGFFLEAAPLHPMLTGATLPVFGPAQHDVMARLAHVSGLIALHVDGLLPGDDGGTVTLRADGRPRLDYPVLPHLVEAMRASHDALARVHLAGGALRAFTMHTDPVQIRSPDDLPQLLGLPYGAHQHAIFTAHQMGGCAMSPDPERGVVDVDHRHHRVPNLFVVDGSVLPTALGVNPSQTIYGLARRARASVGAAV